MPHFASSATMVLLIVVLSWGCQRSTPSSARGNPNQSHDLSLADASSEPASAADIDAFGQQVMSAVETQDIDQLRNLIAMRPLLLRSIATANSSREFKSKYIESVGAVSLDPILHAILTPAAGGGSVVFLGARDLDGRKSALFRIVQPNGQLNYWDMLVGRFASGEMKCIDFRNFATGRYISEELHDDFLKFVAKFDSVPGQSTPEFEASLQHQAELEKITQAARAGDAELACALIATLPANLQTNRRVLIVKIQACMQLGGDRLSSSIKEFSEQFPNDPATHMYGLQASMLGENHDETLRLLGVLAEFIGGDPYLDVLRAEQYLLKSDHPTAKRIAMDAAERVPNLDLAYWLLARVAVKEEASADAVQWLDKLSAVEDRIEAIEAALHDFPAFLESAEFQQWRARRSAGRNPAE